MSNSNRWHIYDANSKDLATTDDWPEEEAAAELITFMENLAYYQATDCIKETLAGIKIHWQRVFADSDDAVADLNRFIKYWNTHCAEEYKL